MQVPKVDRDHMADNHVMLRCAIADVLRGHLHPGSVRVRAGEHVTMGAWLGSVGNSGNSGEPHLHVHAQSRGSTETPLDGKPRPIAFTARFPVRGDHIVLHMKRILVTGATGQVGAAVISALRVFDHFVVRAGVRDVETESLRWNGDARVEPVAFDFLDPRSHDAALADCDSLFLLRPPQLTGDFGDVIARAQHHGVRHIVFLSVQGAERNRFIPHHKIERRLVASGVSYTMLRPAYFMQNFTSTLHDELVRRHRIFLPAGSACFTLVDVGDIARVAALVLTQHGTQHYGQAYTLTSQTPLTFEQMAAQLTTKLGLRITYDSPSPWRFYRTLRRDGREPGLILIMLLLHLLPRFTGTPAVTQTVAALTGQPPVEFAQFVEAHRDELLLDMDKP